jgi:hypothetical protein
MEKRMRSLGARDFAVMDKPMTEEELRKIDDDEFENWVVRRLFGRVSQRKSADMDIDGYTFEGNPIQVKQSDDVGRNVIDNFQTALRRANSKEGVIVAFSFGRGADEEIARCKLRDGLEIKAIKDKDLLEDIGLKPPKISTLKKEKQDLQIHNQKMISGLVYLNQQMFMLRGYIDSLRSEIIGLFFTITVIVHFIKSQIEGLQRLRFYYNIHDFLPLIRAYNGEKDIRIQDIKLAVIRHLKYC